MKQILTVVALMWMVLLSACDDDKPENVQDRIKRSWHLGTTGFVKKDGVDVTSEYQNLVLTFNTNGTYATLNAKKLFFPSGSWTWSGSGIDAFTIDGDLDFSVEELTTTKLRVSFSMSESDVNPNGRPQAVVGDYEVQLEAR